jgi:hypothetical protein
MAQSPSLLHMKSKHPCCPPCLQRSVWIGPPGLLGLTFSTGSSETPYEIFSPSPVLFSICLSVICPPAVCLTFPLDGRGSICCWVGAVHNTDAVVCDMGWDGMAFPYRDYLICTYGAIDEMHQINPAHRVACPSPPFSPEANESGSFLWPLGFSP